MKVGIALSALIVVVFVSVLIVINQGSPATPATTMRGETLERVDLPDDLPSLHRPINPNAEAASLYREAFELYNRHEATLTSERAAGRETHVQSLRALMIEAMDAGRVRDGFLDEDMPMALHEDGKYETAMVGCMQLLVTEAQRLHAAGDVDAARRTALALWRFGQRAFEDNLRLANRRRGLRAMRDAVALLQLYAEQDGELDTAALQQWHDALEAVHEAWAEKQKAIQSTDPHPGDLRNLARHDRDRTFRIAATRWLGVAKFTADRQIDREAVQHTIDLLKDNEDGDVAAAAEAADTMTQRQMRMIR